MGIAISVCQFVTVSGITSPIANLQVYQASLLYIQSVVGCQRIHHCLTSSGSLPMVASGYTIMSFKPYHHSMLRLPAVC